MEAVKTVSTFLFFLQTLIRFIFFDFFIQILSSSLLFICAGKCEDQGQGAGGVLQEMDGGECIKARIGRLGTKPARWIGRGRVLGEHAGRGRHGRELQDRRPRSSRP